MYCPTCGQQANEQVKFCSRCGFPLAPVTQFIANIESAKPAEVKPSKKEMTERRKGIRRGAQILFFSLVAFPITLGIAIAVDGPEALIFPFTIFLAGALWMLYYRLFGDDTPIAPPQYVPPQLGTTPPRSALPAPYENSVAGLYTPARNTADMMEKPSVTETTTKLLDDN
jgi:hypothetical protein